MAVPFAPTFSGQVSLSASTRLSIVPPEPLPERPPPTRRQVVQPVHGMDTYNSHPATGLTVESLLSFYRSAEQGSPVRQFDCFDDLIEIDGHLRGLIDGRIQSVAGQTWTLLPGSDDKGSATAAAALEEILRNDLGFRDFIEHQLTAPYFGFAATNLVWDLVDGIIAPSRFVNVAHRRFAAPSAERADEIVLVNGLTFEDFIELTPGQWAVSRYRGRNPWSSGLMRTAAWWAMFKRWAFRDWQVFADMFGLPLVVGYYEEGAGPESRRVLEEAVKQIGTDGYAVLSNMTEIIIKDTARSGDASSIWPAIADRCEAQMSKLINGATLTTDVGGKGSYALGGVHESQQFARSRADARRLEEMFVRDIGRPFVAWNGFGGAKPPRLKMQIVREQSLKERSEVLSTLHTMGQPLDMDQIAEEFSLRTPAPGRALPPPVPKTQPAGGKPAPGGDDE